MTEDEEALHLLTHTEHKKYYPNGQIESQSWTLNRELDSELKWYDENGKLFQHRLYKDMDKYGIDNFKMEVLFACPKLDARKAEQFVMDACDGELYNKKRAVKL